MTWIGSLTHSALATPDPAFPYTLGPVADLPPTTRIAAVTAYVATTFQASLQGFVAAGSAIMAGTDITTVPAGFTGWVTMPLAITAVPGGGFVAGPDVYEWPGGSGWVGVTLSGGQLGSNGGTGGQKIANSNNVIGGHATFIPAAFLTVFDTWLPPLITDEELAARGWYSAQQALAGSIDSHRTVTTRAEWHGTTTDPNRGAFALVREGGVLEDMVGEVLRVSAGHRSAFVYVVDSSDELDEDLSLARRAFFALGNASDESIVARVAVVQGA
jgi:hypothetical protein